MSHVTEPAMFLEQLARRLGEGQADCKREMFGSRTYSEQSNH